MGITLKAARVNAGMTIRDACKRLGVSETTLINYEAGKTYPSIPVLKKIERLYGVSYDNIIFLPDKYS